jgi:CopG-like RHH_1 or ribbon-helix-helix domain, RHH_5
MSSYSQISVDAHSWYESTRSSADICLFSKEVYAALVKWAEEEDRPVSNLVVRLVAKAVDEKESK